jgi:2-C-methyl-D-erythritol 4-phosphate cytidylyltransferase
VEELVQKNQYKKVKQIIPGGKERYDSTLAAIAAYPDDETNLLFHDAVRPFVSERIIQDCIEALQHYNAVGVAVKTTDTIISVDANECIDTILNRAVLRNVQTPQCFKRGLIKQAYDLALQDPLFTTTDDCGVIRRYMPQEPVYMVNGEHTNIKITYPEDLLSFDRWLQQSNKKNDIL